MYFPVVDPDLRIGGGGGHPDPEIRRGSLQKKQFGLKIRGEPPSAPPLDPPLFPLISGWREGMTGNTSGFESYIK